MRSKRVKKVASTLAPLNDFRQSKSSPYHILVSPTKTRGHAAPADIFDIRTAHCPSFDADKKPGTEFMSRSLSTVVDNCYRPVSCSCAGKFEGWETASGRSLREFALPAKPRLRYPRRSLLIPRRYLHTPRIRHTDRLSIRAFN